MPILKDAGVTRSAVFGSVASGQAREDSDIDILVDLPEDKSLFDFVRLQSALENALGKKVDLGEFSEIKPRIRDNVLKSALRIL